MTWTIAIYAAVEWCTCSSSSSNTLTFTERNGSLTTSDGQTLAAGGKDPLKAQWIDGNGKLIALSAK
jgi:hypothetical protein